MDPVGLTLSVAYCLDLAVGDPRWLPHPVRGLGWAIRRGEVFLRRAVQKEELAGWLLVAWISLGTWLLVEGLLLAAGGIAPWLNRLVEVLLLYACLSTRDLAVESWPVYRHLKAGRLPEAREALRMIVGRDTELLEAPEVVRATVETIGESTMDGIVAPMFYAALGGVPLGCLYKAVNTLDSMVGYRSARYVRFGRAAARVDSILNWIPARITGWLIGLAATLIGLSGRGSLHILHRDALPRKENSWIPEAAMAGALGVRLGGTNLYHGKAVQTPWLGDPLRPLTPERIPHAIRLMYTSSFLGIVGALTTRWGVLRLFG